MVCADKEYGMSCDSADMSCDNVIVSCDKICVTSEVT